MPKMVLRYQGMVYTGAVVQGSNFGPMPFLPQPMTDGYQWELLATRQTKIQISNGVKTILW